MEKEITSRKNAHPTNEYSSCFESVFYILSMPNSIDKSHHFTTALNKCEQLLCYTEKRQVAIKRKFLLRFQ